jgi:uncharacterized protein
MDYKSFKGAPVSIENDTVSGIVSVMGNIDAYGDIVCPGAFLKTIQENGKRFKWLWSHNPFEPPTAKVLKAYEIGKGDLPSTVIDKAPDATGGLVMDRQYLQTPRAQEILMGITSGALDELSIGYDPIKVDYGVQMGKSVAYLRELKLYEGSDVVFGANDATVSSKAVLEMAIQAGQHWIAFNQDKAGRVLSAANEGKLRSAVATLQDVIDSTEPTQDDNTDKSTTPTNVEFAVTPLDESLKKARNNLFVHLALSKIRLLELED